MTLDLREITGRFMALGYYQTEWDATLDGAVLI